MDKQKLLDNLDLRIKSCRDEMDYYANKMDTTPQDHFGRWPMNYDEMYAAAVGRLDAYTALKDAIQEGQFE